MMSNTNAVIRAGDTYTTSSGRHVEFMEDLCVADPITASCFKVDGEHPIAGSSMEDDLRKMFADIAENGGIDRHG